MNPKKCNLTQIPAQVNDMCQNFKAIEINNQKNKINKSDLYKANSNFLQRQIPSEMQ